MKKILIGVILVLGLVANSTYSKHSKIKIGELVGALQYHNKKMLSNSKSKIQKIQEDNKFFNHLINQVKNALHDEKIRLNNPMNLLLMEIEQHGNNMLFQTNKKFNQYKQDVDKFNNLIGNAIPN